MVNQEKGVIYWAVADENFSDYFGYDECLWFTEHGSMAVVDGHDADTPIFTTLSRAFNARLGLEPDVLVPDDVETWPAGERWLEWSATQQ